MAHATIRPKVGMVNGPRWRKGIIESEYSVFVVRRGGTAAAAACRTFWHGRRSGLQGLGNRLGIGAGNTVKPKTVLEASYELELKSKCVREFATVEVAVDVDAPFSRPVGWRATT